MQEIQKEIDPKEQGRTTKPRYNKRISKWAWLSPSHAVGFVMQPENKIAVLGILLIQFALLPSNWTGDLPHISLPIMLLMGLSLNLKNLIMYHHTNRKTYYYFDYLNHFLVFLLL